MASCPALGEKRRDAALAYVRRHGRACDPTAAHHQHSLAAHAPRSVPACLNPYCLGISVRSQTIWQPTLCASRVLRPVMHLHQVQARKSMNGFHRRSTSFCRRSSYQLSAYLGGVSAGKKRRVDRQAFLPTTTLRGQDIQRQNPSNSSNPFFGINHLRH